MYDTNTLALVAIASLTFGCLVGAWALNRFAPERKNRKALEDHIQRLQRQQQDYQEQVNEHFGKTAELLNQLASSYRDVHNHLARSAQQLTSHGISPLQPLPEGKPVLESDSSPVIVQPPLDYAPRSPGGKGALHEEFGLDKEKRREDDPIIPTGA